MFRSLLSWQHHTETHRGNTGYKHTRTHSTSNSGRGFILALLIQHNAGALPQEKPLALFVKKNNNCLLPLVNIVVMVDGEEPLQINIKTDPNIDHISLPIEMTMYSKDKNNLNQFKLTHLDDSGKAHP